jgi:hypothetical protein
MAGRLKKGATQPLWDGKTAKKIAQELKRGLTS